MRRVSVTWSGLGTATIKTASATTKEEELVKEVNGRKTKGVEWKKGLGKSSLAISFFARAPFVATLRCYCRHTHYAFSVFSFGSLLVFVSDIYEPSFKRSQPFFQNHTSLTTPPSSTVHPSHINLLNNHSNSTSSLCHASWLQPSLPFHLPSTIDLWDRAPRSVIFALNLGTSTLAVNEMLLRWPLHSDVLATLLYRDVRNRSDTGIDD
ncbi:hypothetical protein BT96DRAFT_1005714 [Gymnopus androsaceus JB14]|uniref:Uncharacterized protein n=1 Tax=Gymnopus androsaceus JB14 TaxID=1447944 RepID=A0A6A4GNA3_9AGAR|nr:hypothetical protein BT96DRAFT_1005714 [Gymnopus androsaceus JB14]